MNIFENQRYSRENPSNQISEIAAIEATVIDVRRQYLQFLAGFEKRRVIFKTDFIDGNLPLTVMLDTLITFSDANYEDLRPKLDVIFEDNRIKDGNGNSKVFSDNLEKIPPPLTEKLKLFNEFTKDSKTEVHVSLEHLKGINNPSHALVIETYTDPSQKFSKFPLAEIWMVTKLETKTPIANNRAVVPYNAIPEARVRRVSGGGPSGFRDRR